MLDLPTTRRTGKPVAFVSPRRGKSAVWKAEAPGGHQHHSRRVSTRQQLKGTQGLNQMLKKP